MKIEDLIQEIWDNQTEMNDSCGMITREEAVLKCVEIIKNNVILGGVVGQSELLTDFVVWLNENRAQYEIPEHDDVKEYLGCL